MKYECDLFYNGHTDFCFQTTVDVTLEGLLLHFFKEAYDEKRVQLEKDTLRRAEYVDFHASNPYFDPSSFTSGLV